MTEYQLVMVREHIQQIPLYHLPHGFTIKHFKSGDERKWVAIETKAGEFQTEEKAMERFRNEFGPHIDEMEKRCLFLFNEKEEAIGTITAWFGELAGETMGRIHWLGIIPEYQGMSLAKPLLSHALQVMEKYHSNVYLTTQTSSFQAVNLYLNYGFQAYPQSKGCHKAWMIMEERLKRTILS